MNSEIMLSQEQVNFFNREGYLVIPDFYDLEGEIIPIQRQIYQIIGLVIKRHGLSIKRAPFHGKNFDDGYLSLISQNRDFGGEVYDLVKQIPSFLRLISLPRAENLFCFLRNTDIPGIGAASYGIRIDPPGEDRFRSHWHQEFLFQPQSMDGLVFWTPLIEITEDIGPVELCPRSQKAGLFTYTRSEKYSTKVGAYKIGLSNEIDAISKYKKISPLSKPGDLIVIDFLTLHQSGFNTAKRARWSIQSRFFNFKDEVGMQIGWKPSITIGADIEKIFPKNFLS